MDLYARSNIQDFNCTLAAQPHEKVKTLLWWHAFFLADSDDVPYNVNGRPFVVTPGGDSYLGNELDLLITYSVAPRASTFLGYSHFFAGAWYRTNRAALFAGDADFVYTQFAVEF